jgi:uncharacterized protein YecT (DUF1311 family)
MKKAKNLLTAFALLAPLAFCKAAKADGIDCSKATNYIEKLICTNAEVKAQDQTMEKLYAVARVNMYGKGPSGEIANQKRWLLSRQICLPESGTKRITCILDEYKKRNIQLAFSALPKAPELALQVLRAQNIDTEPYYEALTIFTSEPDGTDWLAPALSAKREKIEKLVAPAFAANKKNRNAEPDSHFNSALFEEASVATTDDILKSSGNFADFFRAVTYDAQTPMPCGYVVSHQGLLDATNGYFGANPDNFIIQSDCEVTAPTTPKLRAMLADINNNWPECDGTIRFAAYRQFSVTIDRVLSPSAHTIEDFNPADASRPNKHHSAVGVSMAAINAAENEMTAYYVKYLGVASAKARIFAKGKIADMLYDAHQCE